jgi:hypothetical protein
LCQTIRTDFSKNWQFLDDEDPLVRGDVFRPPVSANLLIALVGSGFQVAIGSISVFAIAALGDLAPLSTGSMVTIIAVVFIVVAPFGGFMAAKLHRTFGRGGWKMNLVRSDWIFTGPALLLYIGVNVVFIRNESAAATLYGLAELFVVVF